MSDYKPDFISSNVGISNIHSIELRPTDLELAKGYDHRMREQLDALCQLENEAASEGFTFSYQIGFNGFGRKAVQSLVVLKKLT